GRDRHLSQPRAQVDARGNEAPHRGPLEQEGKRRPRHATSESTEVIRDEARDACGTIRVVSEEHVRIIAGRALELEGWFEGQPIRDEYLIVDGGKRAGTGARSYAVGGARRAAAGPVLIRRSRRKLTGGVECSRDGRRAPGGPTHNGHHLRTHADGIAARRA